MPENERAREGKWRSKSACRDDADDDDDEDEERVSTSDRTKYRPTYFRDLTPSADTEPIPAMRREIARLKEGGMFLHIDAVIRCSRAARAGYPEWRITGYRDGTVTHERNQSVLATLQIAHSTNESLISLACLTDTQNASRCAEIAVEFGIDSELVENDLRLLPFNSCM